ITPRRLTPPTSRADASSPPLWGPAAIDASRLKTLRSGGHAAGATSSTPSNIRPSTRVQPRWWGLPTHLTLTCVFRLSYHVPVPCETRANEPGVRQGVSHAASRAACYPEGRPALHCH